MTRVHTETKEQPQEMTSLLDNYVFMDKTFNALEVAMKTQQNIILYGPGGHGKSEYSTEYLFEKNIAAYVITMGKGMTTDRLFGGLNLKEYESSGKIEYLVENSFMNHEYVIFEEIMDAPDYILEQLKDILSSGEFRNGSQVFTLRTKLIIGCTNKTRAEFSKNDSLRALMERFPLEHNVIWDNYNDIAYKTLLEKRYGVNTIDPMIPFLLQEYSHNNIIISPRIALAAYEVFEVCGPDNLIYIAEFARNPQLINDSLTKFQETIKFKQLGAEIEDIVIAMSSVTANVTDQQKADFVKNYRDLHAKAALVKAIVATDDIIQQHAALVKVVKDHLEQFEGRYRSALTAISVKNSAAAKKKKSSVSAEDMPFPGSPEVEETEDIELI